MSTTGIGAPQPFQPVSPYSPLGKPAVGLESSENKNQTLPPIEESSGSDKLRERLGQRVGAVDDSNGDHAAPHDEQSEEEAVAESTSADSTAAVPVQPMLRPLAVAGGDTERNTPSTAKALDHFQQTAHPISPPGLLLDREI